MGLLIGCLLRGIDEQGETCNDEDREMVQIRGNPVLLIREAI